MVGIRNLLSVLLLALAGTVCWAQPVEIRERRHVEDMTPQQWQTLTQAIAVLRSRNVFADAAKTILRVPQIDEKGVFVDSYERFVQIHGGGTPQDPGVANEGHCIHFDEEIWSWHRAFLLHFESALRETGVPGAETITIPYWDWTEQATGPNGYPSAFETIPGLIHARTSHQLGSRSPLEAARAPVDNGRSGRDIITNILALSWQQFAGGIKTDGELERRVHNMIHGYIGDVNRNTKRAVDDPIFWAHHANLDRVVDQWQHENAAQCLACSDEVYDRDRRFKPMTAEDLNTNERILLKSAAGEKVIRISYLPKAGQGAILAAETFKLPVALEVTGYQFAVPRTDGARIMLSVRDLHPPQEKSYRIIIYLYPAKIRYSKAPGFQKRYAVDIHGVFASGSHDHGRHRMDLDITRYIRALPATERGSQYVVALRFESAQAGESFADIANEIDYGRLELIQRDAFETERISTRPVLIQ